MFRTHVIPRGVLHAALACLLPHLWLGTFSRAAQDPGLVAWYTFEEGPGDTIKDWSGLGNDGKNLGAEFVDLGVGKGFALRFGDADGYVDCGNDPSLDLTETLTIELWLYPETYRVKGGIAGLVGKSLSSYALTCEGNSCWFFIAQDAMRTDCSAAATLREWNHIVVTFDGKFSRTYTDGRQVGTQESLFQKIDHGANMYLRFPVAWGGKVEPTVLCMMDDVRVYNRVLSKEEVITHYRQEGKARGKNMSRFESVELTAHASAVAREAMLEVDFAGMELELFLPDATLNLELAQVSTGNVAARSEISELPDSGQTSWTVNTAELAPGDYEFRAVVVSAAGEPFGVPAVAAVKVSAGPPAWAQTISGQKCLNNFVAELLDVPEIRKEEKTEYTFKNVRDGWVFIAATVAAGSRVTLTVAGEGLVLQGGDAEETVEVMRHLAAGTHALSLGSEGSSLPTKLVVRAIPEIIYAELGYEPCPFPTSYGPYTWDYLDKTGLLRNVNVILQRTPQPENREHIEDWCKRGKKLLYYYNLSWLLSKEGALNSDSVYGEWSTKAAFLTAGYGGLMLDELSGHSYLDQYPAFTEAVRRIAARAQFKGRVFYPYCTDLYESEPSRAFTQVILNAGYKLVEEKYLFEEPTEDAARKTIEDRLRTTLLRYQDYFEDCATKMIMNLGYISIPHQTQFVCTNADAKVYMDMQMNMLANDPVFLGLYGVMWYHSAYADEELLRWAVKLYRHYCIEGRRERLTTDPYELPHIANGDFDEGTASWTIEPAEDGSVAVARAFNYGQMQGRMTRAGQGDNVLVMRRSAQAPNRLRQPIEELTPGRLYSLKLFVMDYGDFSEGKSVQESHPFHTGIEGAERLEKYSFRELFTNQKQARPFTGENRLHMTFCRIVFRAQRETGALTISDWASDNDPGGLADQQLAFNFISVEPYLEEESRQ